MSMLGSFTDYLWRVWLFASRGQTLAIVFGVGFAILAITLLILSRTKWGQTKPLTKCVVLSVLAHVWLLMYALGTWEVMPQGDPNGNRNSTVAIRLEGTGSLEGDSLDPNLMSELAASMATETVGTDGESPDDQADEMSIEPASPAPWESTASLAEMPLPESLAQPLDLPPVDSESVENSALQELLADSTPAPLPDLPPEPEQPSTEPVDSSMQDAVSGLPELPGDFADSQPPPADRAAPALPDAVPTSITPPPLTTTRVAQQQLRPRPPADPNSTPPPLNAQLPSEYQLRQAPNRLQAAAAFGATADTERAVDAGLAWLARSQSNSGAWVARDFGAGTETKALGHDRYGTGGKADTGVSGLALLAFLSAGHTHLTGDYREVVTGGLRYLLDAQMPSGDLSGRKQMGNERSVLNARMYCHSIATLALAEAYVMTQDDALRGAVIRAAQYSINAQDVVGGGWRYSPGEAGDLSQFGWQAMALKSVERAGVAVPRIVKERMRRFLDSCAAGSEGGLATYLPGQGFPSETMTAEALACRLLLGHRGTAAAQQQALDAIMSKLPGTQQDNVYYWYYATLALFQLQDENWQVWNRALKTRLLATQRTATQSAAGSWDPDKLWGGYGGRVYSTAMSCLSLEVYYRYLPMYQPVSVAGRRRDFQR
ncbi:MAG: prenyltransferase/squalene oxidase repeat-containing protein [Aureliella sp.]